MPHGFPSSARLLAALVLLGLAGSGRPPLAAAPAVEHVVRGRYVEVRGQVAAPWVEQAAHLGDLLATTLAARWKRDPRGGRGPLLLRLHPTRDAFVAALPRVAPRHLVGAGGWTDADGARSDVWLQGHAFDTRRLVLHELTHQVQSRCQDAAQRGRGPRWWREGLAETLGHHARTSAGTWRLAALDVVQAFDENRQAAARVAAAGYDPLERVMSAEPTDYVDGLALVGGLYRSSDPEWTRVLADFEEEVLVRGAGTEAFVRLVGHRRLRLAAAVRRTWALRGPRPGD